MTVRKQGVKWFFVLWSSFGEGSMLRLLQCEVPTVEMRKRIRQGMHSKNENCKNMLTMRDEEGRPNASNNAGALHKNTQKMLKTRWRDKQNLQWDDRPFGSR
jgi:hypothetical protein